MAIEMVDPFFNSGFEQDAVIAAGSPEVERTVKVIFFDEYNAVEIGDLTVESQDPFIWIRTSDTAGVQQNDRVRIGTIDYYVNERKPDGTGLTQITLSKKRTR